MDCPVCASKLSNYDHEGVSVDRCPNGCGEFLESGELKAVSQRELAPRPAAERAAEQEAASKRSDGEILSVIMQEGPRACPVCSGRMQKLEYGFASAVVIDRCAGHGIWLDTDELNRIEAYSEGERQRVGLGHKTETDPDGSSAMLEFAAGIDDALAG